MEMEKSAEVILRLLTTTEGPNLELRGIVFDCARKGGVVIKTEMFWTYNHEDEQNSSGGV